MPALNTDLRLRLEEFLPGLFRAGHFDLRFRVEDGEEGELRVLLDGSDADLVLQRSGELLVALEHVAAKVLRLSPEEQGQLVFDCRDFKALRVAELELTATTAAERVQQSGRPMALNPMDSRERRIIHLALKDRDGIFTESEGSGATRKVVIYPK